LFLSRVPILFPELFFLNIIRYHLLIHKNIILPLSFKKRKKVYLTNYGILVENHVSIPDKLSLFSELLVLQWLCSKNLKGVDEIDREARQSRN
jgi:hypothetical protein